MEAKFQLRCSFLEFVFDSSLRHTNLFLKISNLYYFCK